MALRFAPVQGKVLATLDSACAQASRTKNAARREAVSLKALVAVGPLLADATNSGWVAQLRRVDRLGTDRYVVRLVMGRATLVDTIAATHPVLTALAALEVGAPVRFGADRFAFRDTRIQQVAVPTARQRPTSAHAAVGPGLTLPTGGLGLRKPASLKDAVCAQRFVVALRVIREDSTALPRDP